jgi:hypothetical protein
MELVCVYVLPLWTVFGCKILTFGGMNPASCLFFKILETKEASHGGVVSTQVEFLSMEVFIKLFQTLHNSE